MDGKKYMQRYSVVSVIKETQVKITAWLTQKRLTLPSVGKDVD